MAVEHILQQHKIEVGWDQNGRISPATSSDGQMYSELAKESVRN